MKIRQFTYLLSILILAFTGCVQEEMLPASEIEEGVPVTVRLMFSAPEPSVVMTKGLQQELDESRVNSLQVLVFNSAGKLVTNHTFPTSKLTYTDVTKSEGYVDLPTVSGSNMKIFGIANILANSDFNVATGSITNIDGLEALPVVVADNNKTISRGANFLMSGWFNDGTAASLGASDVEILSSSEQSLKYIYLSRIDAKVEFKFTTGDNIDKFTPLSYAVCNVPMEAYLCGYDSEGTPAALGAGYPYNENCFSTAPVNFDNADNANAFGFYILESNLAAKQEATEFAHRDLKDKGTIEDGHNSGEYGYIDEDGNRGKDWNGEWAYANTWSPYVQIKGRIEYPDTETGYISANVTYNIHLGNFSDSFNDFATRRNTHYTYNVTVNGAEDINVEVHNQNERMPSVEGTVVIADGEIYTVDSHYSSRIMEFSSGTITEEEAEALTWYISTPYSAGTPQNTDKENLDYKWVEFYPQETYTGITASYTDYIEWIGGVDDSRYYVEELVNDLKTWYTDKASSKWPDAENLYVTAFVNEFYYDNGTQDSPDGGTGSEAELTAMWKKVANADDRYMHILCDVHESVDGSSISMGSAYSIFQHSIQTIYNTDPEITELKTGWGTEMVCDESDSQIMDIYGLDEDMSGRLYGQIYANASTVGTKDDNKTDRFNGRHNTVLLWGESLSWTGSNDSKVTESEYGPVLSSIAPEANPAVYACMTRNRDNDGSGILEPKEIKWYMAALDQYIGLYVGEQGLNPDAKLYPISEYSDSRYHYLTSTAGLYTYSGNNAYVPEGYAQKSGPAWNNGYVFWAEEAGATSPSDINWEPAQQNLRVRCLRNLGADSNEIDEIGEDVQMYSSFDEGEITNEDGSVAKIGVVTSAFLNTQSLREKVFAEGEQYGVGDEKYSSNRPHVEFFITTENSNDSYEYSYDEVKSYIEAGALDDVCPEGWRVPYGKELSLMFALIPSDADAESYNGEFIDWSNPDGTDSGSVGTGWISSTYSSFGDYGTAGGMSGRGCIMVTGNGNMTLSGGNSPHVGYIRCVKDNTAYAPQTPVMTLNDGGSAF